MKKLGQLLVAALMLAVSVFSFAGCQTKLDPGTLKIKMLAAAYGDSWAHELKARFEEKTGIKVHIESTPAYYNTTFEAELLVGDTADLYFSASYNFRDLLARGNKLTGKEDKAMADLTDIMNETVEGEDVLLKEKLMPEVERYMNVNPQSPTGEYYAIPWINGPNGMMYNKTVFDANGWEVPRTTNELITLTNTIRESGITHSETGKKITPYVWAPTGYWQYVYYVWQAQYDGKENFDNFWQGKDINGKFSPEAFLQPGRLESLKVMSTVIDAKNCFVGSTSMDFTDAQMKLLEGEAVMMPNGEWLEVEMQTNFKPGEVDLGVMQTPVISSLGTKIGISEEQLIKIIDTIDDTTIPESEKIAGKHNIPSTLTDAQLKLVKDARRMINTAFADSCAVVQATSPRIDKAKEFLKFMATDEALEIFTKSTLASSGAYKYNATENSSIMDNATNFQKEKLELMKNPILIYNDATNPMFYRNSLTGYNQYKIPESKLGAVSVADRKTAQEIFTDEYNYVKSRWEDFKTNANLN